MNGNFTDLMKQAVGIKSGQMNKLKKEFDSHPCFVKSGLFYSEKYDQIRKSDFQTRFDKCNQLKQEGNEKFQNKLFFKAQQDYEQALSIYRYILNKNPNWKNIGIIDEDLEYYDDGDQYEQKSQIQEIKCQIYLNLALCYQQKSEIQSAIQACDEALKIHPLNTKAFYRRAKIKFDSINCTLDDIRSSISDINQALQITPNDRFLQQELLRFNNEMQKYKKDESKFLGMFQRDYFKQSIEKSYEDQQKHEQKKHKEQQEMLKKQQRLFNKQQNSEKQKEINEISLQKLDFDQPDEFMIKSAQQFGLDLNDTNVINELKRLKQINQNKQQDLNDQNIDSNKDVQNISKFQKDKIKIYQENQKKNQNINLTENKNKNNTQNENEQLKQNQNDHDLKISKIKSKFDFQDFFMYFFVLLILMALIYKLIIK